MQEHRVQLCFMMWMPLNFLCTTLKTCVRSASIVVILFNVFCLWFYTVNQFFMVMDICTFCYHNLKRVCVQVDGYPLYSMATPTLTGTEEMVAHLGAKGGSEGSVGQKVVVTDLREEAVLYINGTPFVQRELKKPVDSLKHIGITGQVVCKFGMIHGLQITVINSFVGLQDST